MRYLVCLLGGVLLGVLIALTASSMLRERHAWPRALMTVMQHELGRARDLDHDDECATPQAVSAAAHLDLMAADIESAVLAPGAHDRVFSQYASDLRAAISTFAAARDCPAAREALKKIGSACDACHRDYR